MWQCRDDEHDDLQAESRGEQGKNKDPSAVAQAVRNFKRDYTAPRLGTFTPQAGGPRGVVSGMLAASPAVRPNNDGKSFTVYFAGKRARPRQGEQLSAVETVYGNRLNDGTLQRFMNKPEAQRALKQAADRMVSNSAKKAVQEANKAVRNIRGLADELDGEDE